MSNRNLRVNELIHREISTVLRQRYQVEAAPITITEVRVSPDILDARVFVGIVGDEATVEAKMKWLRSKARDIRERVANTIVLKNIPRFEYVLDDSAVRGTRMIQLLDDLHQRERKPE